jgi:hypothetical protein
MAGLRPSDLPQSGLVQRRFNLIPRDCVDGEFNSILALPFGFLPSLDHLIRPCFIEHNLSTVFDIPDPGTSISSLTILRTHLYMECGPFVSP